MDENVNIKKSKCVKTAVDTVRGLKLKIKAIEAMELLEQELNSFPMELLPLSKNWLSLVQQLKKRWFNFQK